MPRILRVSGAIAWRVLAVAGALYVLGQVVAYLAAIVVPVAIALLLAALLSPAVALLQTRRVPRGVATALVVVAGLAALGAILTFVVITFVRGVPALAAQLSTTVDSVAGWLATGPLKIGQDQLAGIQPNPYGSAYPRHEADGRDCAPPSGTSRDPGQRPTERPDSYRGPRTCRPTGAARSRAVRQSLVDEIERRDASGFRRWLDAGPARTVIPACTSPTTRVDRRSCLPQYRGRVAPDMATARGRPATASARRPETSLTTVREHRSPGVAVPATLADLAERRNQARSSRGGSGSTRRLGARMTGRGLRRAAGPGLGPGCW
ncbi:hypothetical protein GCM10009836_03460 [Pseudonocardia ailaonensis]|uniref:AI-2E family transporter n=1 Tax=Pseudonocardia ailaonensis TaxID=367279 RepID=A0ABN2MKD0_9PSEU